MERLFKSLIILGSSAVAIVCFQNCSNVSFSAAQPGNVSKIGNVNVGEGAVETPATDTELRATCLNLKNNQSNLIAIGNGGSIADVNGNTILKAAGNITTVARVYGNFNILGTVVDGTIGSIDASHGNIIVCGMNVGKITNYSHGNIIVVGGDVGDVETFNGNLRVVDGQILGTISNSHGNIAGN